eukprot:Nk52_evm2s2290 gene=Nk52_evmTU2s2290
MSKSDLSHISIALGSKSEIKQRAVSRVFPECSITSFDCSSGVSSQPVGQQETQAGALNRAKAAAEEMGKQKETGALHVLGMGIENGMWEGEIQKEGETSPRMVDGACIAVWDHSRKSSSMEWSEVLEIPPPDQRPFPPGRDGEWSALKDPHSVLTNGEKSREQFLVGALQQWRNRWEAERNET